MTKLIELFEEAIYGNPYDTHGFMEVKGVENRYYKDLKETVTEFIKENGSDALVAFQRGLKHGKIELYPLDIALDQKYFAFLFQIDEYGVKQDCMGVFTEEQMEQYLEKYIEQTIKQKIYGLLDEIQKVMEAKNINEAILKKWKTITEDDRIRLFWATGKDNYEASTCRIRDFGTAVVEPYFENVPELMAASDIVICRAGASTISELIQLEKPSVLIPYDFVGQKENADVLEYANGAKIFTNETVEEAIDEALSIVRQASMLEFMSENVKTLKKGNSAETIVGEMGL